MNYHYTKIYENAEFKSLKDDQCIVVTFRSLLDSNTFISLARRHFPRNVIMLVEYSSSSSIYYLTLEVPFFVNENFFDEYISNLQRDLYVG